MKQITSLKEKSFKLTKLRFRGKIYSWRIQTIRSITYKFILKANIWHKRIRPFYHKNSLKRYLSVTKRKERWNSSYYFEKAIEVTLVCIQLESERHAFSVDLKEILSLNENKEMDIRGLPWAHSGDTRGTS